MKTKQHDFSRQICASVWKEKSEEGHQSYWQSSHSNCSPSLSYIKVPETGHTEQNFSVFTSRTDWTDVFREDCCCWCDVGDKHSSNSYSWLNRKQPKPGQLCALFFCNVSPLLSIKVSQILNVIFEITYVSVRTEMQVCRKCRSLSMCTHIIF